MNDMEKYVPSILICGDVQEFTQQAADCSFKVAGQIYFFGNFNGEIFNFFQDGKFLLNGEFHVHQELFSMMEKEIDYIVFNDPVILANITYALQSIGYVRSQLISLREFKIGNVRGGGFFTIRKLIIICLHF